MQKSPKLFHHTFKVRGLQLQKEQRQKQLSADKFVTTQIWKLKNFMSLFSNVFSLHVHFEFFAILSYCLHLSSACCVTSRHHSPRPHTMCSLSLYFKPLCTKRLLVCSPNTSRDSKLRKPRLSKMKNLYFLSIYTRWVGSLSEKTISCYCP